jgi:hydroxyethylthiazole kinase-like uncharacterized protein yjeF
MPITSPVLVSAAEMSDLEATAIAAGAGESALMEEAGAGLAQAVRQFRPAPGLAVIFAGKGHNAGDAFVLARHLIAGGWEVECRAAWPEADWRHLTREKFDSIRHQVRMVPMESAAPVSRRPILLIDGLLGTGTGGILKTPVKEACCTMNHLRLSLNAETLAIDLPSGMDPESGALDGDTVVADFTVTLGFPKAGLHAPAASGHTGRLARVPLAALAAPDGSESREMLITPETLRPLLRRRPFSMHKGEAGRAGIVAGSEGFTGAARLAATAAAAAGGGLVTLFCPHSIYEILAASCPPEVMVRPVRSCLEVMAFPLDAIGIGPGMGSAPLPCLATLLLEDTRPVIVDADALNAMAAGPVSLGNRTGGLRLLTPHPGELKRLAAALTPGSARPAEDLAISQHAVVLAKSARSAVIESGKPTRWNTTGHPCMARGGMGDVLTGFMTAFIALGMDPADAAALGSWLIGCAAEIHQRTGSGAPEDFSASQLIRLTGQALAALRNPETL